MPITYINSTILINSFALLIAEIEDEPSEHQTSAKCKIPEQKISSIIRTWTIKENTKE